MKAKKKLTQQHRESISKATKGENNPMYGRHHTEEAKARQAAGRKGLRYVTLNGVKHKFRLENLVASLPFMDIQVDLDDKKQLKNYMKYLVIIQYNVQDMIDGKIKQ